MNRIRQHITYPKVARQEPALTRREPLTGIAWTRERNAFLREKYSAMSGDELAAIFGTTRRAVYRQANKLGLHRNVIPRVINGAA